MQHRQWTASETADLVFWRNQSLKIDAIARRLQRTPGSVKQKLQRLNLIIDPFSRRRRRSGQLTRAVSQRLRRGQTVTEIATALDVHHSSVCRIRKKLGIAPATRAERVSRAWVFRLARGDKMPNRWLDRARKN